MLNLVPAHDTAEAVAITDQAATALLAREKDLLPVVGEICPVGTMAKLVKMTRLLQELRLLVAMA